MCIQPLKARKEKYQVSTTKIELLDNGIETSFGDVSSMPQALLLVRAGDRNLVRVHDRSLDQSMRHRIRPGSVFLFIHQIPDAVLEDDMYWKLVRQDSEFEEYRRTTGLRRKYIFTGIIPGKGYMKLVGYGDGSNSNGCFSQPSKYFSNL
jgi:hypothetical protein